MLPIIHGKRQRLGDVDNALQSLAINGRSLPMHFCDDPRGDVAEPREMDPDMKAFYAFHCSA